MICYRDMTFCPFWKDCVEGIEAIELDKQIAKIMDSEQREGIKEGMKARREGKVKPWREVKKELKPDKIEWCPQHGYPLPCAKCGMPKPDQPSRLLTGNEWMDIWATGVKDEEHRRVYVNYLSGLIRQDDKTASIVRAEVLKEVGEWRNEPCPHYAHIPPDRLVTTITKSDCDICWGELVATPNKS